MMMKNSLDNLIKPARYFPITAERYSTRAGLMRFGKDFGNGQQDQQLFQFDTTFSEYRNNKFTAREQAINDYVCTDDIAPSMLAASAEFILRHLCSEHPETFSLHPSAQNMKLDCHLTREQLIINSDYSLATQHQTSYKNLFDALALQVQEDICLMHVGGSTTRLIAAHLCAANHWSALDKLLMDMPTLHQDVPGFTEDNKEPDKLLLSIANKAEPYVRFAWGLCDKAILNQHPNNKSVDTSSDKLFMRIERQVIWPIPDSEILLFTIRTYFRDCATLDKQQRSSLINAVNSMSAATLKYKNINKEDVLKKLKII